jgi:hypothetical protein
MPQVCLKPASAANSTRGFAWLIRQTQTLIGHRNRMLFRKYGVLIDAALSGAGHRPSNRSADG